MAVTYGFYDSLNHDRLYNAQQMSAIFDGIINDGVFMSVGNQFHTVAGTGMQVIVKSGRAWFDSTWTLNDAEYPLSIDAADVLLTRIDAVVLEVNSEVATRANTIKVVKGTPASTPAKPTLTNTATIHQHALAYVTVAKNTTAITNSMIEIIVGKTETPYVTAILQTTDITDLFNKWENDFQVWFETVRSTLDGDIALNLQNQIDALTRSILSPSTKTLLNLDSSATSDDAFKKIASMKPFRKILEYTTAGSYTWTPPNLYNTNEYYIGVVLIGGGSSGSVGYNSSRNTYGSPGGPSGYMNSKVFKISTNKTYNIVVGAGGASVTSPLREDNKYQDHVGNAGGSSSFDGYVVNGGTSVPAIDSNNTGPYWGGIPSMSSSDGLISTDYKAIDISNEYSHDITIRIDTLYNPFEFKYMIIGSGGGVSVDRDSVQKIYKGGKDSITKKGGGDGNATASMSSTIKAEDASSPGSGGGSAGAPYDYNIKLTSGKGADGAIYIYALGVDF